MAFFGLIAVFSASVNAAPETKSKKVTRNCYIRHLKSVGKLEAKYPESAGETAVNCSNVFEEFQQQFQSKIIENARKNSQTGDYTKCDKKDPRYHGWMEDVMLVHVFESAKGISNRNYSAALRQAKKSLEEASASCLIDARIESMFDEVLKREGLTEDPEEDFCLRKYVVDHHLLDANIYSIEANPKNLDTATFDCDKFYKTQLENFRVTILNQLRGELNDQQIDCVMKQIKEGKYFEKSMSVSVFRLLSLTERQKEAARSTFVSAMKDVLSVKAKCKQ